MRALRPLRLEGFLCAGLLSVPATVWAGAPDGPVSFRNDVMAVLSKAGCNAGVCHGNRSGKGGFKLSLRGEDPRHDFASLTRDQSARRTNPFEPDRSLLLLKPTMQVPHEGGRRFAVDSAEYRLVRAWIAAGLPPDRDDTPRLVELHVTPREAFLLEPADAQQLQVEAVYDDGTRRDVTRLAVYEASNRTVEVDAGGTVRRASFGEATVTVRYLEHQAPVRLAFVPARPEFCWTGPPPANFIDEHVFAKLRALRMNPSPPADDTVFLRRAFLDLLGVLPTADEARTFTADGGTDKRARLVDGLLERPEFAEFWAQKWSDLLRNEEKTLDRKGVENFYAWIKLSIAQNKPLDQFVRELLAARGSTYSQPEANFYRALRDPLTRAESAAQLFLGVRLQCAKCHNHPFDRWTQDDYYGWANVFARVDYKILENRRRDRNDDHEFDGEQVVYIKPTGDVTNPRTQAPAPPRFLGSQTASFDAQGDRLRQLAIWVTDPANKRFPRSQVNRIWYHLMGRGIVDPIDDFRATNPAVNPALLSALADDFVAHGFDGQHSIRLIMNSRTYQLSSEPNASNVDDEVNFSHAATGRLSAEQLLDAVCRVVGADVHFNGYPPGVRAGQLPGVRAVRLRDEAASTADEFLTLFGKPPRLQPCECERTGDSTLGQTFQLISGPLLNALLTRGDNRLGRLLESEMPAPEIVQQLYWTALSRPPNPDEASRAVQMLTPSPNRRAALEDFTWALLNSQEFTLRR